MHYTVNIFQGSEGKSRQLLSSRTYASRREAADTLNKFGRHVVITRDRDARVYNVYL